MSHRVMGTTNNPAGVSREHRRAIKSLATSIREGVSPEEIRDWLVSVWKGRDPLTGDAVDLRTRKEALQMLMNRGWGQDAQFLVIEAQVRSEQSTTLKRYEGVSTDELIERRNRLLAAGAKRRVIEADSAPVPTAAGAGADDDI